MRTLRMTLGLLLVAFPLAAQRRGTASAPANPYGWELAIGTSAGYADVHVVGQNTDITALMFPAWGSSLVALGAVAPTIPELYMTIPVGQRWALEPTLDIHRTQTNGPTTRFASALGARMDYAFNRAFYAAAGVDLMAVKFTGSPTMAISGVGLAGGYRFHFSGAWSGRFELSHTLWAKDKTAGQLPINVTALSFGAMVAIR